MDQSRGASYRLRAGRARRRGSVLAIVSIISVVMLGMLGLTIDVGRMFVLKNELQTYCDTAALAGVQSLDGTRSGVQYAHTLALEGPLGNAAPNLINFDTNRITTAVDTYSQTFTGTYVDYATAAGAATNSFRFMRVSATVDMPLYFLGVIRGTPRGVTLRASATGGQQSMPATFSTGGLEPFAVAAHNAADPTHFGLIPGTRYTIKWGKLSNKPYSDCEGDAGWPLPAFFPADRGYVDIGQGGGTSNLVKAITYSGYPNQFSVPSQLYVHQELSEVPGNVANPAGQALGNRSTQDPDITSTTWEQYKSSLVNGTANGRRLVTMVIDDPTLSYGTGTNYTIEVIGFGNFLLDPAPRYYNAFSGSNGCFCATYIGPASLMGWSSGATDGTMLYKVALFR